MGKASDNERIKLGATYLNNIAVGIILAGGLIPLFLVVQALERNEIIGFYISTKHLQIALASTCAVLVGLCFRAVADHMLKKIKD
jgi:hypothetical protein